MKTTGSILLCLLCLVIIVLGIIMSRQSNRDLDIHNSVGGSREAIFSRFAYLPFETPFLGPKLYQNQSPIKIISGRPYRFYYQKDGSWLNPWSYPLPIDRKCINQSLEKCQEPPIILVKKEEEKLHGLASPTPPDLFLPSPCFNQQYQLCQQQNQNI